MSHSDVYQIPEQLKGALRRMLLEQIKAATMLDIHELELFDWYVDKTESLLSEMQAGELAFIQGQVEVGIADINDSGMAAVEYYLKRVRYSHVTCITSSLENFLKHSCATLTTIIGEQNTPFTTSELKGDQWSVKRKFLERYGKFSVPDELWFPIQALIVLRNNLVHDNGATDDLGPEKKNMLAKYNGIRLDGHEVGIEAVYIRTALQAIKSLTQFIERNIKAVADKAICPKVCA